MSVASLSSHLRAAPFAGSPILRAVPFCGPSHLRAAPFAGSPIFGQSHFAGRPICGQHEQVGKQILNVVSFSVKVLADSFHIFARPRTGRVIYFNFYFMLYVFIIPLSLIFGIKCFAKFELTQVLLG
jgi:hypothetical protein